MKKFYNGKNVLNDEKFPNFSSFNYFFFDLNRLRFNLGNNDDVRTILYIE